MRQDYLDIKREISIEGKSLDFYSLNALQRKGYNVTRLPFCIRIMLENVLRNYHMYVITKEHVETLINWSPKPGEKEITFMPARVLMQDSTGVPAIVDIASLRAEMARKGKDPSTISPLIPVDLVIPVNTKINS